MVCGYFEYLYPTPNMFAGSRFRVVLRQVNEKMTDKQVGVFLLKKYVLVHLESPQDKFELLMYKHFLEKKNRFLIMSYG